MFSNGSAWTEQGKGKQSGSRGDRKQVRQRGGDDQQDLRIDQTATQEAQKKVLHFLPTRRTTPWRSCAWEEDFINAVGMKMLGAQASCNVPRPAGTDTSNRVLQFIFSPLIQCDDQLLNRGHFHR